MHVAYLVNQYPRISLSFIRREIAGIEEADIKISRYSIRALEIANPTRTLDAALLDPADQAEALKTKVVLDAGWLGLVGHFILVLLQSPLLWLRGFQTVLKLSSHSDRSFFHHIAYMAEACILLHWFKRDEIDHVHVHFGTNATTVAMLCRILGGPTYSFTVHGPEEFDKPLAISLTTKIEQAKFVVAISNFTKSQLCRWCSYEHWAKIHIVRCGLDDSFLTHDSQTSITEVPTFVCVARLTEQKGLFSLLEAAKQLADDGHKFKVVIVGDGPFRPKLEELMTMWKLESFIEFPGWASGATVRERMLEARALVLPSFAEGLPVVIMESLALKRPVITTYIAGIPELVEPDVCGWLFPSGNVKALTAAMKKALSIEISDLETMGAVGAERVAKQHNASAEAQKLATLFQKSLGWPRNIPNSTGYNSVSVNLTLGDKVTQNS